jgi:hypothetical protein
MRWRKPDWLLTATICGQIPNMLIIAPRANVCNFPRPVAQRKRLVTVPGQRWFSAWAALAIRRSANRAQMEYGDRRRQVSASRSVCRSQFSKGPSSWAGASSAIVWNLDIGWQ